MKIVRVVAAVIRDGDRIFATARGYGEYKGWWEFLGGGHRRSAGAEGSRGCPVVDEENAGERAVAAGGSDDHRCDIQGAILSKCRAFPPAAWLHLSYLAGGEGAGGLRLRHQPRSILPQGRTDLRQIMTGK